MYCTVLYWSLPLNREFQENRNLLTFVGFNLYLVSCIYQVFWQIFVKLMVNLNLCPRSDISLNLRSMWIFILLRASLTFTAIILVIFIFDVILDVLSYSTVPESYNYNIYIISGFSLQVILFSNLIGVKKWMKLELRIKLVRDERFNHYSQLFGFSYKTLRDFLVYK